MCVDLSIYEQLLGILYKPDFVAYIKYHYVEVNLKQRMNIISLLDFHTCFFSVINLIGTLDTSIQVKLEGDINQGVAYYKKALYYNWHYADAMYNLGVAYGEMLKFDMVRDRK